MPITFGSHEFIAPPEIGFEPGAPIQQVYLGDQLIWPGSEVPTDQGGYRLIQNGCRRLTQNGSGNFRLIQAGAGLPSHPDPIIASVLDRMCQLSPEEETAVAGLVGCLLANGMWGAIKNIWGFGLNAHDYLTSWIDDDINVDPTQVGPLIPGGPVSPTKLPLQVGFSGQAYYRTTNTLDQMLGGKTASGVFVYQVANVEADGNFRQTLFGAADTGGQLYECNWRGTPLRDYDLVFGDDGPLPRPPDAVFPANTRFGDGDGNEAVRGDMIGGWSTGSTATVLQQLDLQLSAARTFVNMPARVLQAPGLNNDGVSIETMAQQQAIMVMISADDFTGAEVTVLRSCVHQFARDIGLTNVGQVDP